MMRIQGACHCGNISFEFAWDPDPAEIPARVRDCSFCTKHGGVWTTYATGQLRIALRETRNVSNYAFGTETAQFHICTCCGVAPVATCTMGGRLYAVVNVNTFDNVAPSLLRRVPASFDGESVETRLARRKRGWIADVRFVTAGA